MSKRTLSKDASEGKRCLKGEKIEEFKNLTETLF